MSRRSRITYRLNGKDRQIAMAGDDEADDAAWLLRPSPDQVKIGAFRNS